MPDARLDQLGQFRSAGEHLAAIRLAEQILEDPAELTDAEAFEVARSGTAAAILARRFHVANRLASQMHLWANATEDIDRKATAAYYQGTVLLKLDDAPQAADALEEFVSLAEGRSNLDKYRGVALFNLGVAYLQQKQSRLAQGRFAASREACRVLGDKIGETRANLEMAWLALTDNRVEAAGHYLDLAKEGLREQPDDHLQAVRLVHAAFYHYRLGEIGQAIALGEELFGFDRPGVTPHERSEMAWIMGECALSKGDLKSAAYMAALATDEAIKAQWSALMNKANDLRNRVSQATGDNQGL